MNVSELIELALAGVNEERVEIASVEPAEISTEAVSGVSQIIEELAANAAAFSGPEQIVTVNGVFDGDKYLISISDDGVGISESMMAALNRILAATDHGEGGPSLGITVVARQATRLGVAVQLIPGVPGTTARVSLPPNLVTPISEPDPPLITSVRSHAISVEEMSATDYASESEEAAALARYEQEFRSEPGHIVSMSEAAREEAQAFLESVFAPLRGSFAGRDRPSGRMPADPLASSARDIVPDARPPVDRDPQVSTSTLRSRIPGQNFSAIEDEPSIVSSEAAVDLRVALGKYADGRRTASKEVPTD